MKTAIVTGASSGIGKKVAAKLLIEGFKVYGCGRDFSDCELVLNQNFIKVECDLRNFALVEQIFGSLKKECKEIELIINGAGVGYYGPHEQLNPSKIHELVSVNLEAPMIISNIFLRELKANEGTIINISSVTAKKSNTHGCAYGATKAGLTSFGESLFDEVRKYGVRVINIHPDMTRTKLYRNADFTYSNENDESLLADEVADVVWNCIDVRRGAVITDITIKPQKHAIKRK